jgi:hypothetical protein
MITCKIADIVVELVYSSELIHDSFYAFPCEEAVEPQFTWVLKWNCLPELPKDIAWIDYDGFSVGRVLDKVYVSYSNAHIYQIPLIVYEDHFKSVTYYYQGASLQELGDKQKEALKTYLYAFHREAFFLGMLYYEGISIHSASIIYQDRGIVFAAPSGTGKSTHTNLWQQQYQTPILDGDVTVCRWMKNCCMIYGLPWSGTSGLFINRGVELECLVFLQQAPTNRLHTLTKYEAFQQLFCRSFTPLWEVGLAQQRIKITENILSLITQIYSLECLPDCEAVETIKRELDANWK